MGKWLCRTSVYAPVPTAEVHEGNRGSKGCGSKTDSKEKLCKVAPQFLASVSARARRSPLPDQRAGVQGNKAQAARAAVRRQKASLAEFNMGKQAEDRLPVEVRQNVSGIIHLSDTDVLLGQVGKHISGFSQLGVFPPAKSDQAKKKEQKEGFGSLCSTSDILLPAAGGCRV